MHGRTPLVGGNWKMNLHQAEVIALASAVARPAERVDVVVYPAFVHLAEVRRRLEHTAVKLGAQDFYPQPNGAFTGEVSLSMLTDLGVGVVLAGHSERRHVIGEVDTLVNTKVCAALDAGFEVVLCVGETLEQRQSGRTDAIIAAQTYYGLAGVRADQMARVAIAYEPVWAIGTGKTATPEDAQAAHAEIRVTLGRVFDDGVAVATRIQYGGSVNPGNAAALFAQQDVDGGLIGGASLKADDFLAIVEAAA